MIATKLRKLIREEIHKVLKEATGKAYALKLMFGPESKFATRDLKAYAKEHYFDSVGKKLSLNAVLQKLSPNELSYWMAEDEPRLSRDRDYAKEAKQLLSKFTLTHDFYDTFEASYSWDGKNEFYGHLPVISIIPKGNKPISYARERGYVLVIDEDGYFMQDELASYDFSLDLDGPKITAAKAAKFPTESSAWASAPQLAKTQNGEWLQAIAKLGTKYDYYNVLSTEDGTEKAAVAAIPKGKRLKDFA